ncbi:hypothetical protein BD769DRAFT_1720012 [Suillus cothurnatus]|nr:hypothetical protein BD769DRAFT_1720012 [Suillus cothurnatus]
MDPVLSQTAAADSDSVSKTFDRIDEDDGVEVEEDEVEGNEVDEDEDEDEDEDVDDDDEAEDESEDNDVDVDDEYEEEEADVDEGEGVDVDVDDEDTDEVDEASEANESSDVDHASDADEAYEAYEALHVNEDSGCDDGFGSDDNSRNHSSFSSRSNGQPSYNIFTNVINVNTTEVHATEVLPMQENNHEDVNNNDSHLRRQPLSHPGPNDPPHERQPSNGLPPKKDGNNNNFRPHQSPNPTQPQKVGNKHDAHPGPRLGPNDPPSGHKSKIPKGPRPKKDSNNNNPHPRQPPNPPQPKKVGKTHAGLRPGPNDLHPGHQLPNHPRPKKDGNNNNPRLPPNPPHPKKVGNNHDAHPRPHGPRLGPNDPPTGHQLPNCLRPKKNGNNNDFHPRQLPNPLQPQKVSNNDDPHPEPSLGPNDLPSGQQLPNHPRPKKDGNNNSDPCLRQPPNPQQPKKVGNNRDLRPRPKPLNLPPPNSEHGKKLETHANESHSGITITWNGQKVRSPNGQPDHPKDGALDCANEKHGASRDKASKVNGQSLYDIKIQVFPTVWNASVAGDLHTAEELLTQEIDKDGSKDDSYAIRSVVRARNLEWDNALQDAVKSIAIQPSLWGYVSKGLALCGNEQLWDAMEAFDLAITFSDRDPVTIDLLLLIKAVVIFNAGRHNEALRRVQRLATADQHSDALRCSMVDAYLRVQLAMITFQNGLYSKAADELTASITTITDLFSPTALLEPRWKIFTLLFGWNFDTLWQTINQRRCDALLHADRVTEAVKSFQYMMSMIDDNTKSGCLEWSSAFKKDCTARCVAKGDEVLAASNYEMAIELYSAAITLDSSHDSCFTRRSSAYLARKHYVEALADADTVIKLSPSSHRGPELKHAALDGVQQSDKKTNETFESMLSKLKLTDASDSQIQGKS